MLPKRYFDPDTGELVFERDDPELEGAAAEALGIARDELKRLEDELFYGDVGGDA